MRLAAIALVLVSASGVAQRTLTLPFSYENDFIVVEARLNDVAVTRLLFDTGSELTILTEPLLFSFLDPAGVEEITLVGSDRTTAIPAALVRRNRLDLGPVTLSNHAVVIVDDAALDLSDLAGEGIGGILGVGTFGAYVVEVNYRRSTIRLIPPRRFSPPRGATAIPLEVFGGKPHIRVDTRIHAAYRDSILYLLDTGAALEALVFASPADSTLYPPQVIAGVIGHGLGGALQGFVGRSDSLAIGPDPIPGAVTHFQIAAPTTLARANSPRGGILGNRLLNRYDLAIDYPGQMVYFSPRRQRAPRKPRPYDRSGLTLVSEGSGASARVQFVAPGTPAALAGVHAGDLLRKINGIPVRLLSLEQIRRRLRRSPGTTVRLVLVRRGEDYTADFALRDLI